MPRSRPLASALACLALAAPAMAAPAGLDAYRWTARLLVISAPDDRDAGLGEQMRLLRDQALTERRLVVIRLVGAKVTASDGRTLDAPAVRRVTGLSATRFGVVLIGLDGGVKLTRTAPIGPGELFQTIDAMPMRRDELRRSR